MPTITFVVMTDFTGTVQQVAEHGLQVIQRSLNLCGQEVELNNAPAESWDTEVNVTDRISMQINEGLVADDEEDVADFYRRRGEPLPKGRKWKYVDASSSDHDEEVVNEEGNEEGNEESNEEELPKSEHDDVEEPPAKVQKKERLPCDPEQAVFITIRQQGNTFKFAMKLNETVGQLKLKLHEKTHIPVQEIHLTLHNPPLASLNDDLTLDEYAINETSTLILSRKESFH